MILDVGPLFIFGRVFIIQQWSSTIKDQRDQTTSMPVWVKLMDFPKELWGEDDEGLNFVMSLIRDPIRMDNKAVKR